MLNFIKKIKQNINYNYKMSELKQVLLVRTDIKMSKGKIAAQAAHASIEATLSANKKLVSKWRLSGMKKIALQIENEQQLKELLEKAQQQNIITSIIKDAGHTEVKPGTTTCGAIGPGPEVQIDKITGELKIL